MSLCFCCLSTYIYQFINCFLFGTSLAFSLLVLLSSSLQPATGMDKQETLSVISRLFVCLNECQGKDRGRTHTTICPHPDPTVNILIVVQEPERDPGRQRTGDSRGNTTESQRGSEILFTSWCYTQNSGGLIITGLVTLDLIAGADQCGLNPCCPVQANVG